MNLRCRHCRKNIASERVIEESHSSDCQSYYVDPSEWEHAEKSATEDGKLVCPMCGGKIGRYSWSGYRCCGEWIAPSFAIHKVKVDPVD